MRVCEAALALLLTASPALAAERPPFPPGRDVAVTYRVAASQPGAPQSMLVRYSARADRLRVEAGLPGYVLVDLRSRDAVIVMAQLGLMLPAPRNAGLDQAFALEDGRQFRRRGSSSVAGHRCTLWDVVADAASGTVCVTGDGVLLRAEGQDRHGRSGSLEATGVQYGRQDEALFFPPPGTRRLDIPGVIGERADSAAAVLDRLRGRRP